MKKYNQGNKKAVLMGIIIPILLFFISMNVTFAYFTATAKSGEAQSQTAYLKINFSTDSSVFANSQAITENTKLLPGDTLNANGTIVNESNVPVYVILGFKVFATRQGSSAVETLKDTYYTFSGSNAVEITDNNGTFSGDAITLDAPNAEKTNNCKKDFSVSYTFDFYDFGNEYKNANVTYTVKAYAIQVSQIDNGAKATQILMERFNTASEYQQVEYIESTGTQFIDTKFVPNQDTKLEASLSLTTTIGTQSIFCARTQNAVNSYTLFKMSSHELRYDYNNSATTTTYLLDSEKHTIVADKNKLYVDSALCGESTYSKFSANSNLWIGASYATPEENIAENFTYAKFYSLKIYSGDNLIKNFMPCYRISDGEIGLLDIINNEFYSNSGTGEFLKGNDVDLRS